MNDEQSGSLEPPSAEPSTNDDSFFNQARKIEQDMHAIMTRQVKLALVQIALGILGILTAFLLAVLG